MNLSHRQQHHHANQPRWIDRLRVFSLSLSPTSRSLASRSLIFSPFLSLILSLTALVTPMRNLNTDRERRKDLVCRVAVCLRVTTYADLDLF